MKPIKFLALFALSTIVFSVSAQNTLVYQLFNNQASNTIVRDWDDYYVVSMQLPYAVGTPYQFKLVKKHTIGSSQHQVYSLTLPSGYTITDFFIFNNYVYFIGNNSNLDGLFGHFNLNVLVLGNVSVDFYTFAPEGQLSLPGDTYSETFLFRNFSRVKAFSDGTDTHVLILGKKISKKVSSGLLPTVIYDTVGAIYDVVPNATNYHYAYNNNNDDHEFFDDLVIKPDNIITFGYTGPVGVEGTYIRMFERTSPFTLNTYRSLFRIVQDHIPCISKVYASGLDWYTHQFSILSYYSQYTSYQGLTITAMFNYIEQTSPRMQLVLHGGINQGYTIDPTCTNKGLVMDTIDSILYVLHDMKQPLSDTSHSTILKLHKPTFGSLNVPVTYFGNEKLNSLDLYNNNGYITINNQTNTIKAFTENNQSGSLCGTSTTIPAFWEVDSHTPFSPAYRPLTNLTGSYLHTTSTLTRTTATYNIECEY